VLNNYLGKGTTMKKHYSIITLLVVILFVFSGVMTIAGTDGDSALIPEGKFRLNVGEDLAWSDNTLVAQMTLKINPTEQELGTRIQWRYLDKISYSSWSGQLNKGLEQKMIFIGQFAEGKSTGNKVPVLIYTFQHGIATVSDIQEAKGKTKLDEVLKITAKTGFYSLGTPVIIGDLAGNPIILSVESPTIIK
jgi:hypothetical protein